MRIGKNPNIHKEIELSATSHRVIIPVYIPNAEGYFKDAFNVFKVCVDSLLATINKDTHVTLISNGSSQEVNAYIKGLWRNGKIDRAVFNKENVGKMNAIMAETRASFEEFITYADSDVFFDKGWLKQTYSLFRFFPKAGFVSMNPTPANYAFTTSAILDNFLFWSKNKMKTSQVCDYDDLAHFHKSIGNNEEHTQNMMARNLIFVEREQKAIIGAGHFCCTIRKTPTLKYVPQEKSTIGVSGGSEAIYLDIPFDKTGLWRLSSSKAYVWHMGNVLEKEWAAEKMAALNDFREEDFSFHSIEDSQGILFSKVLPYPLRLKTITLLKKIKLLK